MTWRPIAANVYPILGPVAVHNIVFGQLGTIAFTMHEMGLPQKLVCLCSLLLCAHLFSWQVERFVMSRAHGAQLGRDQQIDLLKSIRYGLVHSPSSSHPSHSSQRDISTEQDRISSSFSRT